MFLRCWACSLITSPYLYLPAVYLFFSLLLMRSMCQTGRKGVLHHMH